MLLPILVILVALFMIMTGVADATATRSNNSSLAQMSIVGRVSIAFMLAFMILHAIDHRFAREDYQTYIETLRVAQAESAEELLSCRCVTTYPIVGEVASAYLFTGRFGAVELLGKSLAKTLVLNYTPDSWLVEDVLAGRTDPGVFNPQGFVVEFHKFWGIVDYPEFRQRLVVILQPNLPTGIGIMEGVS